MHFLSNKFNYFFLFIFLFSNIVTAEVKIKSEAVNIERSAGKGVASYSYDWKKALFGKKEGKQEVTKAKVEKPTALEQKTVKKIIPKYKATPIYEVEEVATVKKKQVAKFNNKLERLKLAELNQQNHKLICNVPDNKIGKYIDKPRWLENAVILKGIKNQPLIAIVIDDLGIDKVRTKKIMDLNAPMTMAFLPYTTNLVAQTKYASEKGHELMVHMPMEPINPSIDPGPDALITGIKPIDLMERLNRNLNKFDNFVGINNHMGSLFTQDVDSMKIVMNRLKHDNLLYLDSKTIGHSLAEDVAKAYNIPSTSRDIFLDHEPTMVFTENALKRLERIALAKGTAVAIGHPKDITILALKKWIPKAEARGFKFVPISTIIQKRSNDIGKNMVASK